MLENIVEGDALTREADFTFLMLAFIRSAFRFLETLDDKESIARIRDNIDSRENDGNRGSGGSDTLSLVVNNVADTTTEEARS